MVTAGAIVLVGTTACGVGGDAPVTYVAAERDQAPDEERVVTTPVGIDVPVGPAIVAGDDATFLPMTHEGRQVQPVAVLEEGFLLAETTISEAGAAEQRFVTWSPDEGERELAWEAEPGRQDIVAGVDGEQVVYVRAGLELPFADWKLQVRDLATGETETLGAGTPEVLTAMGTEAAPPFGVAPRPAVEDGKVAWAEYEVVAGRAMRRVRVHDLATGSTRLVASADGGAGEDVESPTLGGERAAWVRWAPDGTAKIEVVELDTGKWEQLDISANPYAIALDAEGTTLAWDDAHGGKYALSLESGVPVRFAGDEGWGITVSGRRFAWVPAAAYGGTGGYYDLETRELRLLGKKPDVQVNQATVMGDWFVWQELVIGENGQADLNASGYYFLPIGR